MKDNLQKVEGTSPTNPVSKESAPQKEKAPKDAVKKGLSLKTKMVFGLVGTAIVFLGIAYVTYQNLTKIEEAATIAERTVETLEVLEEVIASLSDAETGQRGYLLTGDLKYLEPYNSGVFLVGTRIDNLQQLIGDDQNQQDKIIVLRDLVEQKKDELKETVNLQAEGKGNEAIEIVLSDKGKDIMDDIRAVIADMQKDERGLHDIRDRKLEKIQSSAKIILLLGSILGFFFALFVSFFIIQGKDPNEPT